MQTITFKEFMAGGNFVAASDNFVEGYYQEFLDWLYMPPSGNGLTIEEFSWKSLVYDFLTEEGVLEAYLFIGGLGTTVYVLLEKYKKAKSQENEKDAEYYDKWLKRTILGCLFITIVVYVPEIVNLLLFTHK
jgi:hypothetical protein